LHKNAVLFQFLYCDWKMRILCGNSDQTDVLSFRLGWGWVSLRLGRGSAFETLDIVEVSTQLRLNGVSNA
jgi:hypothetical protein